MEWLSRVLVSVLVVTGISVAIVSDCRSASATQSDGGSCTEQRIGPNMPVAIESELDLPGTRFDGAAVLAEPSLAELRIRATSFPQSQFNRSRGSPKQAFLAIRD